MDAVRPIALAEIHDARARIADTVVRTPMVRLELGPGFPDIRLKLENLQPINAYKLRGAANAVAMLPESERRRGVWTISAGNAGQGVAYAARKAGVPCTVVAIETAPASKLERMRALGATLVTVSYTAAWKALEERSYPGVEGTFVHPFDDHNFIAGHATMGLEILEDAPDTAAVIAGIGGGGLIVASAAPSRRSGRRSGSGAQNRRQPHPRRCPSRWDRRKCSRTGRRRLSTAPEGRACSRACGSACGPWWMADRRESRRDPPGHAADGRESARDRRRRGRAAAGGRVDGEGRSGPDRRHRLRRQHRPRRSSPS